VATPFQNQSPAHRDSPPKQRPFHSLPDRTRHQEANYPLPAPAHAYVPRINAGGNFCGHDPLNPRLELAKPAKQGKGGLPRILTLSMEKLRGFYDNPRQLLPSLDLANGSPRRTRSERREADVLVGQALIKRMDLATMQVGVPTPGGFRGYTLADIAQETGLSLKRVSRVMTDFKAASLITVSEIRKQLADGSWRAVAAIKTVSKHLFEALNLGTMLQRERKKARRRQDARCLEEERAPASQAAKGRLSLVLGGLFQTRTPGRRQPNASPSRSPPSDLPANFEAGKRLQLQAAEVKLKHPHWSRNRIYAEARRLLGSRR